ncbi:UDP-N-acetylmuramoyl-L-alanyl-D-glutamate--2,6-diaminopimelate ligase [uncultured Porticoccus sp.]|jgi:UDP-N-acetylmuramoyl-L-alanyl-D-glutamate--2,6-diaminopimelate ligase|uniref:UDP-N-acetylmuramoyl-L-alanyl-D-glutamate--2, 6-diaminopimelate ligase n=1 Tax=Porticoccus sp. TaxID=2024853 RepID=UPI0030D735A5|tara:strand:+ start:1737 stop:3239 length:1503 start_codon:yes stop_codon:yes gene_type:complete
MTSSVNTPLPTLATLLPGMSLSAALAGTPVKGLCLDSRLLEPGQLFIAIPGTRTDGRDYLSQVLASGAVAALAEADGLDCQDPRVIPVEGLNRQLSELAGRFYGDPSASLSLTGITGTNGKTTCSLLLTQLFSLAGYPAGVIGTLGCGVARDGQVALTETGMTTPDAITLQALLADFVNASVERVAMEVSSHSLDQCRVSALEFDTAVFTNLSRDHLDYHGDLVSYAHAKSRLFTLPGLAHAVINIDDPVGAEMTLQLPPSVALCTYSLCNPAATVYASDITFSVSGLQANVVTPWGEGLLVSPLLGRFNLQNLLAVLAAACIQGLTLEQVLSVLPGLQSVIGRMEKITKGVGPMVIVDYAHTPAALEQVLLTLREHCKGQLWCVFGCGGDRDRGKRGQMGAIVSQLADRTIVTSDNPRSEKPDEIIADIVRGVAEGAAVDAIADRALAIQSAVWEAADADIVLIAGKGHEHYQLIGAERLPFSDQAQARLALKQRGGCR